MRRPDLHEPGMAHAVTFSCYRGFPFLRAERAGACLADALARARDAQRFRLWAYVFIPEHVHRLLGPTTPDFSVSRTMKAIKPPVGMRAVAHRQRSAPQWLPRITRRHGGSVQRCFWQPGGGFDSAEREARAILAQIEYIHQNPVRRGLVPRPEDWRWSSAGWSPPKNPLAPDPIDLGGATAYDGSEG